MRQMASNSQVYLGAYWAGCPLGDISFSIIIDGFVQVSAVPAYVYRHPSGSLIINSQDLAAQVYGTLRQGVGSRRAASGRIEVKLLLQVSYGIGPCGQLVRQ